MAPRIAVVEHESTCPPAHVETWLTDAGAEVRVARPWAGESLPEPGSYDALVVLGGSMGAGDDASYPWLAPLKQQLRDEAERRTPVLGICLGHQLVAVALGGTVQRNPAGQQVGLFDVGWLPEAAEDPLVGGVVGAGTSRGIQWNHDVVTALPSAAVPLARTPSGELQVARFAERAWGVQLHPEADDHVVLAWAEGDRAEHLERGLDQAALIAQIAEARQELDATWRPLTQRFVALA